MTFAWFLAFIAWSVAYTNPTIACVALVFAFAAAVVDQLLVDKPNI